MNDTIYTYLTEDDKIESNPTRVTSTVWSNGNITLNNSSMFIQNAATSSNPLGDFRYYINVFSSNPNTSNPPARSEFSIAYGNISGSGAPLIPDRPTYAIYCQYRNLLLNNPNALFSYPSGSSTKTITHFFAISINRAGFKQRIDPGNWELDLVSSSFALSLIDDSNETNDSIISNKGVFTIVSGSLNLSNNTATRVGNNTYGLFYPDYGILILDADMLMMSVANGGMNFPVNTGTTWTNSNSRTNLHEFFLAIATGSNFIMRSEEIINSSHYFIRVKNKNYNYSSNLTFISGSNAQVRFPQFIDNPRTYITTIGLYDDDNDLLAVAKLSDPVLKSFEHEALFKVRLDF